MNLININHDFLLLFPCSEIFFNSDGEPLKEGDVMYRPILAKTLQTIAEFGESIFYEGDLAEDIVNDIQERGILNKSFLYIVAEEDRFSSQMFQIFD